MFCLMDKHYHVSGGVTLSDERIVESTNIPRQHVDMLARIRHIQCEGVFAINKQDVRVQGRRSTFLNFTKNKK